MRRHLERIGTQYNAGQATKTSSETMPKAKDETRWWNDGLNATHVTIQHTKLTSCDHHANDVDVIISW